MKRREAIVAGGLASLLPFTGLGAKFTSEAKNKASLKIGIAGYSFAYFKENLDQVISIMQEVGVTHMTLKDFQLPFELTSEETAKVISKLKSAGITPYGLGVIYMEKPEDVVRAFDYASRAGIDLIIGSPAEHLLPMVEDKVKSTGVRIAIHNHGPEDKRYPDIDSIYKAIEKLDTKVGICLDVGHSYRCGHNPAEMLKRFGTRVIDMHIKDVTEPVAKGKSTTPGRGQLDLQSVFQTAHEIGFSGFCSLEYERPGHPGMGIAESIGYMRGLIKTIQR